MLESHWPGFSASESGAERRHQNRVHSCGARRAGILSRRGASTTRAWTGARPRAWRGAGHRRPYHRNPHRHTHPCCADSREPTRSGARGGDFGSASDTHGYSGRRPHRCGDTRSYAARGRAVCGRALRRCSLTCRRACATRIRTVSWRASRCGAARGKAYDHRALVRSCTGAGRGGRRPARLAAGRSGSLDSCSRRTGAPIVGVADTARRKTLGEHGENPGA